ncbi:Per1-like protein [Trichoderma citrinoviride]|uniref:Post-GPI attachment to proteins factor 3 n=1 Tax=Trichoderma citrinoviride TaxID=58853 RepID=A0A2T4BKU2_9HYPO|nr:Per1-like protein [Trichoderma citrinoviride]PTB69933.1 Per1-like protein [Trichoderma citrinoviride]
MTAPSGGRPGFRAISLMLLVAALFAGAGLASVGDQLPEFKQCLDICKAENCAPDKATPIPLSRRLLLWDCSSECDYACQHIITASRVASDLPVVQFHGKWPFYRFLGMQEPFSVLFSLGNFWAHWQGLKKVRARIPAGYSLRPYYEAFSYFGLASWVFSSIFHTRDFAATEQLDYFAAGASVLYGMYYTPVRIFRLDRPSPRRRSVVRAWTLLCILLYACHVGYLKGVSWDYTYNMAANVVLGVIQNALWSWFSFDRYRKSRRVWAMWPGLAVAWVMFAMSMELFDFPPWLGCIDAHSLWHLMTIGPTILWYNFLVKDANDDIAGSDRLKA